MCEITDKSVTVCDLLKKFRSNRQDKPICNNIIESEKGNLKWQTENKSTLRIQSFVIRLRRGHILIP